MRTKLPNTDNIFRLSKPFYLNFSCLYCHIFFQVYISLNSKFLNPQYFSQKYFRIIETFQNKRHFYNRQIQLFLENVLFSRICNFSFYFRAYL